MKKSIILLGAILFANFSFSQIYTADGTLSANRTVTLGGKTLNFTPATATPSVGNLFFSSTGNIGLGTLAPTYRFQVNSGDVSINSGKLYIGSTSYNNDATFNWGIKSDKAFFIANSTFPFMEIRSTSPTAYGWGQFAVATLDGNFSTNAKKGDVVLRGFTYGSLLISNDASGSIKFSTREQDIPSVISKIQMTIDKFGNVGVGTELPDSKLAVNGLIHAKEVKVDLIGWPDYVFKNDYSLPTLKEVENQIKENGHLSNIPSEKEVEANGVKIGEMNKLLLQKVEELTLYIIQMNKEIEMLKLQIKKD